jgi:hypothetical protein
VRPSQWISGVRRPGREADHSPASRAQITNKWNYDLSMPVTVAARSKATLLHGLRVEILPEAKMSVFYEFCVLSGRGLYVRRADHWSRGALPVWCV